MYPGVSEGAAKSLEDTAARGGALGEGTCFWGNEALGEGQTAGAAGECQRRWGWMWGRTPSS